MSLGLNELNICIYIGMGVYVSIVVLKQQTLLHFWPMSRDCKRGWRKSTDIYSKHLCFITWILLRWPNVMEMTSSRKGTRCVCSCTAHVISLRYNNTIISSFIFYDCNMLSRELTLYIEFIYWENGVCVWYVRVWVCVCVWERGGRFCCDTEYGMRKTFFKNRDGI